MTTKGSQQKKMLKYMLEHGKLTNREAVVELAINSPTKRLSELRRQNLIESKEIKCLDMNSNGRIVQRTHYTEYSLSDFGLDYVRALNL